MAGRSRLAISTNTLCLIAGWITTSHAVIRNLSNPSTDWKDAWLDVAVLNFGIILVAVGLQGLLRLSEKNDMFRSRSEEGYDERRNDKRRIGSESEGVDKAFNGSH